MLKMHDRGERPADLSSHAKLDWKRALGVDRLRLPGAAGRPKRLLRHRLRKQQFGRGAVAIERVAGGLSNHNFVVRTGGASYFARMCHPRSLLGIDRRNEVVCHDLASGLGIAPELIHHEEGLIVTRFIDGKTLAPADVRETGMIERLGSLLGKLHGAWDGLTGEILYFCPFQTVRTYARTAVRLKASVPADLGELLDDTRQLSRRIAPFRPVLCHNDLLPANLIDDGARLWLVDWEYAGAGHPLFDLANASANVGLADDQERVLLKAYRGYVDPRDLDELRIFRAVSLLREALWSMIQSVASDIDFDYRAYAAEILTAFREARGRLA
jgi:thiamine kinase-like enzyme